MHVDVQNEMCSANRWLLSLIFNYTDFWGKEGLKTARLIKFWKLNLSVLHAFLIRDANPVSWRNETMTKSLDYSGVNVIRPEFSFFHFAHKTRNSVWSLHSSKTYLKNYQTEDNRFSCIVCIIFYSPLFCLFSFLLQIFDKIVSRIESENNPIPLKNQLFDDFSKRIILHF